MLSSRYITTEELNAVIQTVKLTKCIHCGFIGMLILHGYQYGFDEYRGKCVIKARRVFCSNRNRRRGCGRTFSYRLIDFMQRTLISASIAWDFLLFILAGLSIEKAYGEIDPACELSLSSFYRFWERFKQALPRVRTCLADYCPLAPIHEPSAILETIRHMALHLSDTAMNPIARYQKLFQHAFV